MPDWTALRENLTEAKVVELLTELGVEVQVSTLQKWRQRGKGPPWWRSVGSVYYPRDKLRAWLDEQQQQPTARGRKPRRAQPQAGGAGEETSG